MDTLGAKVDAAVRRAFVGRRRELARLLELMRQPDQLPRIVQLHGPAGIGKTTLLQMWRDECQRRDLCQVVVLHSREFPHTAGGLALALEQRLDPWPPLDGQPVGLAIDGFEDMTDMEWRFREGFLRQLCGPVLLVLAGRRPTPLAELGPGWQDVVEHMPLMALSPTDARTYLQAHGVAEDEAIEHIVRLTRGNPLALAMAADLWVKLGVRDFVSAEARPVLQSLLRRLTSEIRDEELGRLLEAAAVVRSFDQELMGSMVGEVGNEEFSRFCQLSFVRPRSNDGHQLHDLVRRMVIADLQRRKPQAYRRLRQRAYTHLMAIATAGTECDPIQYDVLLELMFLSEEALIHAAFFDVPAEQTPELRPVMSDEHDQVRELAMAWAAELPAVDLDLLREQLDLFLRLAPERFYFALDEGGAPAGFCNLLPLNRATLPELRRLWSFYLDRADQQELWAYRNAPQGDGSAGLVTGFVVSPGDHPEVHAALLRATVLRAAQQTQRLIAITPHPQYKQLLERLHFEKAGAAGNLYSSDLRHEVFVLDLSRLEFEGWIQRLLGISRPETTGGRLSGELVRLVSRPGAAAPHEKLSPRELDLLTGVAAGLGNKQIARRFSISENTVRNHLTNIYRKLEVPDRSHAILYAIRERLVEVG